METIEQRVKANQRSMAAQAPPGQDLIEREPREVAPTETASLMAVIARAAADPAVNVEKMEKLLAMQERVSAREAEQSFNAAMTAAQTAVRPIAADASNPSTKSKYASYLALDKALRPIYVRHGFSLSFDTADGAPPDCVRVICYVSHSDGHSRTYKIDMPADGKGAKGGDVMTKTHATGSAVSYGTRYLLKMIFNIAVGEDDDGNSAGGGNEAVTQEQLDRIDELIERSGADVEAFVKYMGVEAKKDIRAKDYEKAITALNTKLHRSAKKADGK